MIGGVYLLQPNEELVKMEEKEYDSEALLQTLLAKQTSWRPGTLTCSAGTFMKHLDTIPGGRQ